MKLGYTIWNDHHFTHYPEILAELREIGIEVITIVPQYLLDRDDRARLIALSLPVKNVVEEARRHGFELMLKPHFMPRESQGKQPHNWQGWVGSVGMNSWALLMGRIKLELESLTREHKPKYLCIGSDLFGTHMQRREWRDLIGTLTHFDVSLVYANTPWQPLIRRFRWQLFWASIFGGYKRALKLAFSSELFKVPENQQNEIGKSVHRSGFKFSLDAVGLNLYFPPQEDQIDEELMAQWFNYSWNGFEANYVESIEAWHGTNPLWITECDLVGDRRSEENFYQKWWETCLEVWGERSEMLICFENGEPQWIDMIRNSRQINKLINEWTKQRKSATEESVYRRFPSRRRDIVKR